MSIPVLSDRFASELPEMAVPWQAADAPAPRLVVLNQPMARELQIEATLGLLTGTQVPSGSHPVAQAYSGHQFGGYTPQLGDGRALLLGELADGRDLHLKGSGRTPFSRGGDGYAALGPMLREYVISEAMHALGIPTTRSLAVVATGRIIQRETPQPGAVLARIASSHLRVGSFQFARATDNQDLLRRLADQAIARHHPEAAAADHPYLALFEAVIAAQASLVARWMLVGFIHGVMNTDNMTISGETIDYGPCAFMEAYDPATVFSSIDTTGRYAYGNQPVVAEWNLTRFAEALLPLFNDEEDEAIRVATLSLSSFRAKYATAWTHGMRAKLGLPSNVTDDVVAGLSNELLALMHHSRVDHTSFFRDLTRTDPEAARSRILDLQAFDDWSSRWRELGPDAEVMDRTNPVYVPRNRLVEAALGAATAGDVTVFESLLEVVSQPFDERSGLEDYAAPGPDEPGYQTFCGT